MKTFQVEQNYGDSCKGWIYFDSNSNDLKELEKTAIAEARKDWEKINQGPTFLAAPQPCRPTIKVHEFSDGKRVKNGINFKTKWR